MMARLRTPLIIIIVIAIFIILAPGSIGQQLRSFTYVIFTPILKPTSAVSTWVHTRYTNLKNLDQIHQENATLKQEVISLQQQVVDLATAAKENEELRAELGISSRPSAEDTIAATIISRSSSNLLGEALIDQGANAGIEPGQAVMSRGVFVGQIKEVFAKNALVTLVNSSDAKVQAMLTDSEALGLVIGGPTGLKLIEVDQGIEIKEGEIVQTSGLGGTVPKGLIIGGVDRVTSDQSSAQQEALVRSSINFDQLKLVFVILRSPPQ